MNSRIVLLQRFSWNFHKYITRGIHVPRSFGQDFESNNIVGISSNRVWKESFSKKKKKEVWKESNSLANNYEFDDHWSTSKL